MIQIILDSNNIPYKLVISSEKEYFFMLKGGKSTLRRGKWSRVIKKDVAVFIVNYRSGNHKSEIEKSVESATDLDLFRVNPTLQVESSHV
jgi:hypothetical protein